MPRVAVVDPRFGAMLRRLREARGLSARRLSALVPFSGGYVNQYETGVRRPTVETARRLDELLDAGGELAALVTERETTPSTFPILGAIQAMTDSGWAEMLRRA